MATDIDKLNNDAVLKIVRISEALVKTADRFFSKYGVSAVQYDVLVQLKYSEKKLTQSDLGERRIVSRSNITGIVDRLEKLGMAKREGSANDRRIKYITITQKGRDLIGKAENKYFDVLKQIVWFLDEKDKNDIFELLNKLERGIKRSENE
jgi:DNA-binding MarR family transcriptional regulator